MSNDSKKWHNFYVNNLSSDEQEVVGEAYNALVTTFKSYSMQTSGDDRAEELIAAITKYLVESR